MMNSPEHIVVFDGVCNLCDWSIRFIAQRDYKKMYYFCPLQSQMGQSILKKMNFPQTDFKTILLVENDRIFTESTAVLRIAKDFSFPWSLISWFLIVPKFIRDAVYRVISNNRYAWFGKKDVCMIPTHELQERFLDNSKDSTQEKHHVA